jgi:hypothetical protein
VIVTVTDIAIDMSMIRQVVLALVLRHMLLLLLVLTTHNTQPRTIFQRPVDYLQLAIEWNQLQLPLRICLCLRHDTNML